MPLTVSLLPPLPRPHHVPTMFLLPLHTTSPAASSARLRKRLPAARKPPAVGRASRAAPKTHVAAGPQNGAPVRS